MCARAAQFGRTVCECTRKTPRNQKGKVALESEANAPAPLVSLWSVRVAFWGNAQATQLVVSD